jgi:hypothetical protein
MSRNGMTQPRAFFQNAITAGFFMEFWICSFVPILGPILSLFLQSLLAVFGCWYSILRRSTLSCLRDSAHALNFQFGLKFFFGFVFAP